MPYVHLEKEVPLFVKFALTDIDVEKQSDILCNPPKGG